MLGSQNKMKPGLLDNVPWLRAQRNTDLGPSFESSSAQVMQTHQSVGFDLRLWGLSLLSFLPLAVFNSRDNAKQLKTESFESDRGLSKRVIVESNARRSTRVRFRPYVSKVPWHTGARGFLSQMFPRYGNYCGPNWSSGKDNGNLIWDTRPIDWLDFCCYCHDMGYDTHDQAKLLEADLKFLECLEMQDMRTAKGDPYVARLYKTMCTTGLRGILIPYRTQLVNLQLPNLLPQFGWLSNVSWKSWTAPKS